MFMLGAPKRSKIKHFNDYQVLALVPQNVQAADCDEFLTLTPSPEFNHVSKILLPLSATL